MKLEATGLIWTRPGSDASPLASPSHGDARAVRTGRGHASLLSETGDLGSFLAGIVPGGGEVGFDCVVISKLRC
jgi:hypothetical protein